MEVLGSVQKGHIMECMEGAGLASQLKQGNPRKDNPSTGLLNNGEEIVWDDCEGH